MTSDTEPSGECSASSCYQHPSYTKYPYYAFSGDTNIWNSGQGDNWIQYKFEKAVKVNKIKVTPHGTSGDNFHNKSYKLQASNNGVDFIDLTNEIAQAEGEQFHTILNSDYYLYYRLQCYANPSKYCGAKLQFYGRSQN